MKFVLSRSKKSSDATLEKAKEWIIANTVENNGIIVSTEDKNLIYPGVTGYYIPTKMVHGMNLQVKFPIHLIQE